MVDEYSGDIGADAENIRERMMERVAGIQSEETRGCSGVTFGKNGKPHNLGFGGLRGAQLVCLCGTFVKSRTDYDKHLEKVQA